MVLKYFLPDPLSDFSGRHRASPPSVFLDVSYGKEMCCVTLSNPFPSAQSIFRFGLWQFIYCMLSGLSDLTKHLCSVVKLQWDTAGQERFRFVFSSLPLPLTDQES
jgi:hypothetical protein